MLPVKQQVFAFEEDDVCFPRTKQEIRPAHARGGAVSGQRQPAGFGSS